MKSRNENRQAWSNDRGPLRVLHYVSGMSSGGVEKWLVELMHAMAGKVSMDFAVVASESRWGMCAEEAVSLGARVIHSPLHANPSRFDGPFLKLLQENGPYDVVHSHVNAGCGPVMRVARRNHIPVRIAHTHGPPESEACVPKLTLAQRIQSRAIRWLLQRWLRQHPTHYCSISDAAAAAVFRPVIGDCTDVIWLPPAVDLRPFSCEEVMSKRLRRELGLPVDAAVFAHVGRFVDVKNHQFLLQMAKHVVTLMPDSRFLLVGDGPLLSNIKEDADAMGLGKQVLFTGTRSDVPRLLKAVVDAVILPSKSEGLGRVAVEAQAAGIPCLISDVVPPEADVIDELVTRLPLSAGPQQWGDTAMTLVEESQRLSPTEALERVKASPFDIAENARRVLDIYQQAVEDIEAV